MPLHRTVVPVLIAAAAVLAVALATPTEAPAKPSAAKVAKKKRDVMLVGNNWDGTIDVLDVPTYQRLQRINAVPDRE